MTAKHHRPKTLSGKREMRAEGILALEALTDEALVEIFPDYNADEIAVAEIEIWENMPIRALIQPDMIQEWITWTGERWIREVVRDEIADLHALDNERRTEIVEFTIRGS